VLTRSVSIARDLGRIHGVPKLFGRILPWLVRRRYYLYSGSLTRPLPECEAGIPLRIEPAKRSDLARLIRIRPGYYELSRLLKRHEMGHVCFLAWAGGEPIHCRWAFTGSTHLSYLGKQLVLGPQDIFYDETFTVPRFRGLSVDFATLRVMLAWFRDRGFVRHHCLLTSWDFSLHRRAAAFAMRRTGEVRGWNILGWKAFRPQGLLREDGPGRFVIGSARE